MQAHGYDFGSNDFGFLSVVGGDPLDFGDGVGAGNATCVEGG